MEIDLISNIAAVGIPRSRRADQAQLTTNAAPAGVLIVVAQKISELFGLIKTLFQL